MLFLSKTEAIQFVQQRAELFDRSENPFAKSAWLIHFIDQIAQPDWKIIAGLDHRDAVMLLYSTPSAPGKRRALTNYYASLFTPVVGAEGRSAVVDSLVRQLAVGRPSPSTVELAPLSAEAPETVALERALEANGWYVRRYFRHGNWYLPGQPYDQYIAARDSKLRNTIARKGRKFPGELRIVTEPAEVDAAMDAYHAVYAKSWKEQEPYPNFVRGWARICAERGWLRLGIATLDGAPIAAQFWFTLDLRAYIFKLAYDEGHAKWSAGTLLTDKLMRHSLDVDKVVEVDYLTGDDPYKAAWMTHRRERIGLMACNKRTVTGLARAAVEYAGALKHRLQHTSVAV